MVLLCTGPSDRRQHSRIPAVVVSPSSLDLFIVRVMIAPSYLHIPTPPCVGAHSSSMQAILLSHNSLVLRCLQLRIRSTHAPILILIVYTQQESILIHWAPPVCLLPSRMPPSIVNTVSYAYGIHLPSNPLSSTNYIRSYHIPFPWIFYFQLIRTKQLLAGSYSKTRSGL